MESCVLSLCEIDFLIDLLSQEAQYPINHDILRRFLHGGEIIRLQTYDSLIDTGQFDPNVYVIKSGLLRGTYLDNNLEKTVAFGLPGTLLINFHSFYGKETSFFRFEACCQSEVVKIQRKYFEKMITTSHQFAIWVTSAHQNQLYYNEFRYQVLSGDAKTRLMQLTNRLLSGFDSAVINSRWKEIFRIVPSKIIASYIGITEQHLSKIKKELILNPNN